MLENQSDCIICAMARTLKETQENQNQSIKPYYVYSKLRLVCKHLVPGDQEDAHEFLRYLVEAMEKAYLLRFKNSKEFDQYTKETTPLNQILGGYLKSSVRCLSCEHVSVTFQHFQDLLLDIRKSSSIEEALDIHFARERLEDMGYKCESCKRKVSATKQFSMERAPITLCIQLKRFSMMGGKINKHVSFPPRLSLSKYSSRKMGDERQMSYRLVSLVTHLGSSQHCGHYTAVGLTHTGNYYNFDDSSVRQIPVHNVLQSNAYIMFYELEDPSAMTPILQSPKVNCTVTSRSLELTNGAKKPFVGPVSVTTKSLELTNGVKKPFIGPVLPLNPSKPTMITNGSEPKANGNDVPIKSPIPTSKLVLKISQTSNPIKTWNGIKQSATVRSPNNGSLHQSSTGLTPDISNKLNVTAGNASSSPTALARPNHQSDTIPIVEASVSLKPTLPSMPKLDTSSVAAVSPKTPSPPTIVATNGTAGRTPPSTPESASPKPAPTVISHAKTNGTAKIANGFATRVQLVPYDDDSSDYANHSDDDAGKSPPIVKTNSGTFIVTNASSTVKYNGSSGSSANSSLSSLTPNSSGGSSTSSNGAIKRFARKTTDEDNSATVNKLMKFTHNGYGAHVKTWDGKISQMDLEVN